MKLNEKEYNEYKDWEIENFKAMIEKEELQKAFEESKNAERMACEKEVKK